MRIEPGTRAIVTGASRGIGSALCLALASRGARLGLVARDRERLEEVVEQLPESPAGPHLALVADVSKRSQVQRAVYMPGLVRLLGLNGLAPRLTDLVLRRIRGATAAPRRD